MLINTASRVWKVAAAHGVIGVSSVVNSTRKPSPSWWSTTGLTSLMGKSQHKRFSQFIQGTRICNSSRASLQCWPYGQGQDLREHQSGRCDGGGAGRRGRGRVRVLCQESAGGGPEDGRRDHLPPAAVRGAGRSIRERGAEDRPPDHGGVQHPPGPTAWR